MVRNTGSSLNLKTGIKNSVMIFLCIVATSNCSGNEQGHLVSTALGDMNFAPGPRQDYDRDIAQACGELGVTPKGRLLLERDAYLQQVEAESASLVWVSTESDIFVRLDDMSNVAAVVDSSASPKRGAQYIAALTTQASDIQCYQLLQGEVVLQRGGFRSAPADGDATIFFSVMGDLGKNSSDQQAVLTQLKGVRSDLLLITGDVAYDEGTLAQYEAYFFSVYRDILSLIPVFPVSGNHDYKTRDAASFREVFVLPENSGLEGKERWYSFNWGPVHFVMLDTQRRNEVQASWLRADLEANTRPWTIAVLHKPPYSSGSHGSDLAVRRRFQPVMAELGVDLVFAGHEHNYERILPIDGVTHIITGGGGRGTRPVGSDSFTAFSMRVAHFVHVEADANTLTLHAIDASGQEFDSMRLTQ